MNVGRTYMLVEEETGYDPDRDVVNISAIYNEPSPLAEPLRLEMLREEWLPLVRKIGEQIRSNKVSGLLEDESDPDVARRVAEKLLEEGQRGLTEVSPDVYKDEVWKDEEAEDEDQVRYLALSFFFTAEHFDEGNKHFEFAILALGPQEDIEARVSEYTTEFLDGEAEVEGVEYFLLETDAGERYSEFLKEIIVDASTQTQLNTYMQRLCKLFKAE